MVSVQEPLSPNVTEKKKKRKWEITQTEESFEKRSKPETTKSFFEIELQLESPLPFEWQRCLDIQSGQIHFYNTRTHKRTSRDPRRSPEPSPSGDHHHMSLELELNLPCESQRQKQATNDPIISKHSSNASLHNLHNLFPESTRGVHKNSWGDDLQPTPRPSWLAGDDQGEMVATVCTRCHMLVMLCKTSPSCPNCKFLHPPDQTPPELFKPRLSLLC